jgi:hypothetical protein
MGAWGLKNGMTEFDQMTELGKGRSETFRNLVKFRSVSSGY